MTDEDTLSRIKKVLDQHYSEIQKRHADELTLLRTLAEHVEKSRMKLIDSHSAQLDALRELHQRIDAILHPNG